MMASEPYRMADPQQIKRKPQQEKDLVYPEAWEQHQIEMAIFRRQKKLQLDLTSFEQ
jgi:hypothetical protein